MWFSTHQAILWPSWVSFNLTQFWHHLSGDSIRPHRVRAQSYKMSPLLMFISEPGCHLSPVLLTNQRFPQLPEVQPSALGNICLLDWGWVLSHVRLFVAPWTVAHKAPLSMRFSRQEDWSGLPCPPPGNLPSPGFVPSLASPALAGGFFTT